MTDVTDPLSSLVQHHWGEFMEKLRVHFGVKIHDNNFDEVMETFAVEADHKYANFGTISHLFWLSGVADSVNITLRELLDESGIDLPTEAT